MPKLRIPEPYRTGADKLARLPSQSVQELIDVLLREPPLLRPAAFISSVTSKVRSIPPNDARSIIDALFALDAARDFLDLSIDEFAEGVSQTDSLDISAEEREQFKARVRTLLNAAGVAITAKASTLLNEAERRFHDARIVTDIRPIFKDGVESAPAAAIILHTLRIRCHRDFDGKLEDIYLSLDPGDVQELRAILDRADAKAQRLETTLREAGVTRVALQEE